MYFHRTHYVALTLAAWLSGGAALAIADSGDVEQLDPPTAWVDGDISDSDASEEIVRLPLFEWMPLAPLWRPPLANQREPRLYAKLHSEAERSTFDAAIGDVVPVIRWCPSIGGVDAMEIDVFAAAFFRIFELEDVAASDGRMGVWYTCRRGCWTGKIGYEHTSSHLIDEFIVLTGLVNDWNYARDEVTLGLSCDATPNLRIYGQAGIPPTSNYFATLAGEEVHTGLRLDTGFEWYASSLACTFGQPFVAADVEAREEQDYEPNLTLQIGWQLPPGCQPGPRFAAEFYHGKSPFGQFLLDDESWVAFGVYLDR